MNKVDEILEKHLSLMVGRAEQSYVSVDEMKKQPEWESTRNAMIEFGKFLLEEAAENADAFINQDDYAYIEGNVWAEVDKESITDTLNKYL